MLLLFFLIFGLVSAQEEELKFNPTVTAVCRGNDEMVISVRTEEGFNGLLISRNSRNNTNCFKDGTGENLTVLKLNMAASLKDPDYCGVSINHKTSEKTVQIAVRQHKTLELAEDKLFLVSCGKFGSAPPSSPLPARMSFANTNGKEIREVVNQRAYKLRIETDNKDSFLVRNCFSFSSASNVQVPLFDSFGCPESKIMSKWSYTNNQAESTIYSMFRFQDSKIVSFQCHILFCGDDHKADCSEPTCSDSLKSPQPSLLQNNTDVISSITVSVLEPGESLASTDLTGECTSRFCPTWLLWLAIILGVLFLLMLLVNLFLCTALTCTCTRTELIERDPSIIVEDYDPYNNRGYYAGGGGSGINSSRYSIEKIGGKYSESDHYAAVPHNSRPGSRFSSSK